MYSKNVLLLYKNESMEYFDLFTDGLVSRIPQDQTLHQHLMPLQEK